MPTVSQIINLGGKTIASRLVAFGKKVKKRVKSNSGKKSPLDEFWMMIREREQRLSASVNHLEIVESYKEFLTNVEPLSAGGEFTRVLITGKIIQRTSMMIDNSKFGTREITYGEVVKTLKADGGVPAKRAVRTPSRNPRRAPPGKREKTSRKKKKTEVKVSGQKKRR